MLLDHRNLALDIEEVVPDAEIECTLVFLALIGNFLKQFAVKWVYHIDLKCDKHSWLVFQNSHFLNDASSYVLTFAIGLTYHNTEDHVLSDVLLEGFRDHHSEL